MKLLLAAIYPLAFFSGRKQGRETRAAFGLEQILIFQWKLLPLAQLFSFCQGVNVTACSLFFSLLRLPCRTAHGCCSEPLVKINVVCRGNLDSGSPAAGRAQCPLRVSSCFSLLEHYTHHKWDNPTPHQGCSSS